MKLLLSACLLSLLAAMTMDYLSLPKDTGPGPLPMVGRYWAWSDGSITHVATEYLPPEAGCAPWILAAVELESHLPHSQSV